MGVFALYKAVFAAAAILEIVFVPLFLKAMWPKKNKKSLILKMICSGLFLAMILSAAQIRGSWSVFTVLMVLGAFFGFGGDYLLHVKSSTRFFLYGMACFLTGHLCYIAAFTRELLTGADFEYGWQGALSGAFLSLVLLAIAIYGGKKQKARMRLKVMAVSVCIYTAVLLVMFVQALTLAVFYYVYKMPDRTIVFVCLTVGALCFVLSDSTLGLIQFTGKKKSYPLKVFNIVTYFAAQMLLASAVMFVG